MKKIFFVGIGGIGMSSLAIYAKHKKYSVIGSDKDIHSSTIDLLKKNNIIVLHESSIIETMLYDIDILVITNTISIDHPLYLLAKKLNKIILYRSQFLSQLIIDKKILGITGSHGKTTTTSLIGHIFKQANEDPTIFVGGIMQNYKKNLLIGNSNYLIIEADDAYKSFLDLNPFISIITTISYEHLETYKSLQDIEETFLTYAEQTSPMGAVIINTDNNFIKKFITKINHPNIITYGTDNDADYQIKNVIFKSKKSYFSLFYKNHFLSNYSVHLLGIHNIKNAVAAIIASRYSNIKNTAIKEALLSYKGVERRFQYKGKYNGLKVYDDYAHHPVEIDAILSILEIKNIRAYIFFQPHKYIRMKYLWNDFISVFLKYKINIEILYITDVYGVGEDYDDVYNSKNLVEILQTHIKKVIYVPFDYKFKNLLSYKKNLIKKNNNLIILTLGAGLMNRLNDILIQLKK